MYFMPDLVFIEKYSVKVAMQLPIGDEVLDQLSITAKVLCKLVQLPIEHEAVLDLCLTRIDRGVMIKISGTAIVPAQCVRCGKKIDLGIDGSTKEEYVIRGEVLEALYSVSRELTVDLSQQIIDCLGLAIPSTPLCNSDCRGLCTRCGVDLNDHPDHFLQNAGHKTHQTLVNSIKIRYNKPSLKIKKSE